MKQPKYKYYIGKLNNVYLSSNSGIDDEGNAVAESGKYSSYILLLSGNNIFIDLVSLSNYNAIFFYDSNQSLISSFNLLSFNGKVITPPENAAYYSVRFTSDDENFILKKDTKFLYFVKSADPVYKTLNKKSAKENGQEFFRVSLDGKINLFRDDFDYVYNSSLEDRLIFIIENYNESSAEWSNYYKGMFSKTDCKLDPSRKKCELKTHPVDQYTELLNKYENTYDLIKLAPEITKVYLHKRSLIQVYIRGESTISNFFGGTYWESDVSEVIDDGETLVNTYHFAYIRAGNEFYIKDAKISGVNGTYAGINGVFTKWDPGFTCRFEETGTGTGYYYLRLYRNSDNTLLYQSVKTWMFSFWVGPDNKYIGREDVEMRNVNDSTDTFVIKNPFVYHVYMRLLCDVDTIEDADGVKSTYDIPLEDIVIDHRNYKKCIGLKGGSFQCTSRTVKTPTKYGINDYNQYFTDEFIPVSSGLGRPLPICRSAWVNASLWFTYDTEYFLFEERLRKKYSIKDCYYISDAIKAVLKKIDPTITHEATPEYSQFLYSPDRPLGFSNFQVCLTQKTNVLKGDYDQAAQKAEISFGELMDMLRDCFRCYWYIEGNKLKIEHIYYFMNGGSYSSYDTLVQYDFTKLKDQFNRKPALYFQTEIEYDKSDLASRYEFSWMDDCTELFSGITLDVKSEYVQKDKVEDINAKTFSSDVDFMLFNPSNFSNDGFALLCPVITHYYSQYFYTQNDIYETAAVGADFESMKYSSTARITSGLIDVKGTIEITVRSGYRAFITVYDADGKYTGVYHTWVYDSKKIENVQKIAITISTVDNVPITPATITNPVTYRTPNIPELPISEVRLVDDNGNPYSAVIQNWYASWAYITSNFYMYDMPARQIQSNISGSLYAEVKRSMSHSIEFPADKEINSLQLIKTEFGDGKIEEISENVNTHFVKAKLSYKPK